MKYEDSEFLSAVVRTVNESRATRGGPDEDDEYFIRRDLAAEFAASRMGEGDSLGNRTGMYGSRAAEFEEVQSKLERVQTDVGPLADDLDTFIREMEAANCRATSFYSPFVEMYPPDRQSDSLTGECLRLVVVSSMNTRVCRALSDCAYLLRAGRLEAAEGRARTIYESLVLTLIMVSPDTDIDVIERFHCSASLEEGYRIAQMRATAERMGEEPREQSDYEHEVEQFAQDVRSKYGKNIGRHYEWARPLFEPRDRITFAALEKLSHIDLWRPAYHDMSRAVHVSPSSTVGSTAHVFDSADSPTKRDLAFLVSTWMKWSNIQALEYYRWAAWKCQEFDLFENYGYIELCWREFDRFCAETF